MVSKRATKRPLCWVNLKLLHIRFAFVFGKLSLTFAYSLLCWSKVNAVRAKVKACINLSFLKGCCPHQLVHVHKSKVVWMFKVHTDVMLHGVSNKHRLCYRYSKTELESVLSEPTGWREPVLLADFLLLFRITPLNKAIMESSSPFRSNKYIQ